MPSDDATARPDGARPRRELTDPRAMRALAHPVRLALIELLTHTGTLTATQASEALSESPANCAFHLRTLARYGFVEEAGGGRGRERPWRRVDSGIEIPETLASPQATQGARALTDFLAETLLERARSILAGRSSWPAEWQGVLGQGEYISYMTVPEARQLGTELAALLSRYDDRIGHPERRPAGAMPIEILAIGYPLMHLSQIETHPAAARPEADPED
jgi:DNA-binding transcriptional ArsR family regulator